MRLPQRVTMVETAPRDGLQNEPTIVPEKVRTAFIERLADAGLSVIEVGSFVSGSKVPQMAGTDRVLSGLSFRPGVRYPVLVPNLQGLEGARGAGAREVAVFAAASETFSRRNINCSIEQSLERYAEVAAAARGYGMSVRGYVSCVLDCPYEGRIPPEAAARVAQALFAMGCREISLGDTLGTGTPGRAQLLIERVCEHVPRERVAVHFHDTYGQALANILAVLELGVTVVDSSAAGLGGCPYAPGAAGNVSSEDLLYMLDGLGIETGVALEPLIAAGRFITDYLGRPNLSRVAQALCR